MGKTAQDFPEPVAALLAGYRPRAGVADELMEASGQIRPVWHPFLRHLASLSPDRLEAALARGDQYLSDAGVFTRLYAETGSTERLWPLSHVPVLIDEADWAVIARGLRQRADLLEAVVQDLYGAGRLVSEGHLPARLVANNPEWLRPLVGHEQRGGHYLHFLAFELGRSPDGSWFVLGDRAQAPSGAGFALETRVATARVFSSFYPEANVHRLAPFFRRFRDAMNALRETEDSRIGILTPGPMNDTYYEHAYIARYLGFMLLEGEDLVVRDSRVMVRTVDGLWPVSVLWRRLDARFADPLELDAQSHLGTPGLVGAIRAGEVAMVNALGSGVIEARALMAFLPRIAEALTGQPLLLPNIATWWCGQSAARSYVQANADRLMLGPALSSRLFFEDQNTRPGADPEALAARLASSGADLVAQEAVTLSTTPALRDGRLEPRPMSLRVFLARTAEGWAVMPGGYARIGRGADTSVVTTQAGGSVADTWVVGQAPVAAETMAEGPRIAFHRTDLSVLPARAADNLFWLGRYVERLETAVRQLRAYHLRLAESDQPNRPLLHLLQDHLRAQGIETEAHFATPLAEAIARAQACADKMRDRFSVDGWLALKELSQSIEALRRLEALHEDRGDAAARALSRLLRQIGSFSGLVHENMYRFTGWRFLTLGRALERATSMAWTLARFADPAAPEGALDTAVEVGDSLITHRRRYAVSTSRDTVIDLLALDLRNPRAIFHQIDEAKGHIAQLPGQEAQQPLSPLARRVLELHTGLAVMAPEELSSAGLLALRTAIDDLSSLLGDTYFG